MNAITRKRALASQERKQQIIYLSRMSRSILFALAVLVSLGTVILLSADQLYRPDAFVIEQLKIKGKLKYLTPQEIDAIARRELNGNFFSVHLGAIENEIEKLAWVEDASVRREWPNSLMIEVIEQTPIARWGDDAWLNRKGRVVKLPNSEVLSASLKLQGHPRDAQRIWRQSSEWQVALAKQNLQLLETNLSKSNAYRITVSEINDVDNSTPHSFDVILGSEDVERRMRRFLLLYSMQLRGQQSSLQVVDARYPDGLAVRQQPLLKIDSKNGA